MMVVRCFDGDRRSLMHLLLLADEQEQMVMEYIGSGTMLVVDDGGIKGECILSDPSDGIVEILSLAVLPGYQRRGYGRALIRGASSYLQGRASVLRVGTGDSPLTVPFYGKCGFVRSFVIPQFFIEHYDHPIIEGGVQLVDKVYLEMKIPV